MSDPTSTPDAPAPDLSKATPRPWRLEGPDMFGDFNILHEGDALAVAAVVSNMRLPEEVAANAALIVAAVNGYDPAALRAERDEAQPVAERVIPWEPIATSPTDGSRIWVSNGKTVWQVTAWEDGTLHHGTATECKFWCPDIYTPEPPAAAVERAPHGDAGGGAA